MKVEEKVRELRLYVNEKVAEINDLIQTDTALSMLGHETKDIENKTVEELTEILEKIELYNKIYEEIVNQDKLFKKISDYIDIKINEEVARRPYPSYPTCPQPMPIFYEQNPYRPAHEVWCDTKTTLKDEIPTTHTTDTKTTNKLPGLPQYGSKLGE